jgi:amino acid transporter
MAPAEHSEDTPVGALFLHWVFTVFMILVTANLAPLDAYNFLAGVYSYAAFGVFNFLVAAALLKLRFSSQEKWAEKSKANPSISIIAATVFAIGCLYPVIATWVPPMGPYAQVKAAVSWFTVPTVAWSMLAFGAAWYVGFLCYAARRLRKDKVEFKVERIADFEHDPHPNGPLVEVYETVDLSWVAKETSYDQSDEKRTSMSSHDDF